VHGNAVSIISVEERTRRTELRTFVGQNALDCRNLHIGLTLKKNSWGDTPPQKKTPQALPVLGPRHQFLFCSPALPSFLFYEATTNVSIRHFRGKIDVCRADDS